MNQQKQQHNEDAFDDLLGQLVDELANQPTQEPLSVEPEISVPQPEPPVPHVVASPPITPKSNKIIALGIGIGGGLLGAAIVFAAYLLRPSPTPTIQKSQPEASQANSVHGTTHEEAIPLPPKPHPDAQEIKNEQSPTTDNGILEKSTGNVEDEKVTDGTEDTGSTTDTKVKAPTKTPTKRRIRRTRQTTPTKTQPKSSTPKKSAANPFG